MTAHSKLGTGIAVLAALLLVNAAIFLARTAGGRLGPLSVLLITVDSLRADHLGCYGYNGITSPNIDRLASEGVVFETNIGQASWTWPSLNSLISSTYPSTNGAVIWNRGLPDSLETLPEILGKKGYRTGFLSGNHLYLSRRSRWMAGFDTFDIARDAFRAEDITDRALSWVEAGGSKPFFLWLHYMDAHMISIGKSPQTGDPGEYTQRYDSALRLVDRHVGRLLQKLKEAGAYDRTLIVLCADHGEIIGRDNVCGGHGGLLWDELIRPPLIMAGRNLPAGARVARQVQSLDLAPTICDLVKAGTPATFEGRSLVPMIDGAETGREFAFSEHHEVIEDRADRGNPAKDTLIYSKYSIRSQEWKLIYTTGAWVHRRELYDLRADPLESRNVIAKEGTRAALMERELQKWMGRTRPASPSPAKAPDPEILRKMRRDKSFLEKTKEQPMQLKYLQ